MVGTRQEENPAGAGGPERAGTDVPLTPREFGLLVALLRAAGAALSRAALLRDVWRHKADVETRTIDTHIGELRRKLEPDLSARRSTDLRGY